MSPAIEYKRKCPICHRMVLGQEHVEQCVSRAAEYFAELAELTARRVGVKEKARKGLLTFSVKYLKGLAAQAMSRDDTQGLKASSKGSQGLKARGVPKGSRKGSRPRSRPLKAV